MDVVTIGNHRKTSKGYSILASKTGGVFLRVDKPVDVNVALSRYQKHPDCQDSEKIEVRGEKTVLAILPNEERPLPPGVYRITLPAIHGIPRERREIKDVVKIESGKNTAIEVRIRKVGLHSS